MKWLLVAFVVVILFSATSDQSLHRKASAAGTMTLAGPAKLVATYLGWLESFTCKNLGLDCEGSVVVVAETIPGCTVRSPHLREKLTTILTGTSSVQVTVTGSSAMISYDWFQRGGRGTVDVSDVGNLPDPPVPPNTSNNWDKAQQIGHHLDEYYHAARTGDGYAKSHQEGIRSENAVRGENSGSGRRIFGDADRKHTWQGNAKHWFIPDPATPGGKIEVYREDVQTVAGKTQVTARTKSPAPPNTCMDPEPGDMTVFIGEILSVSEPSSSVWSGDMANFQTVTYNVLSVLEGTSPGSQVAITTPIVFGTPEADPLVPQLNKEVFSVGQTRVVEGLVLGGCIDPTVGQLTYWDTAIGESGSVGGVAEFVGIEADGVLDGVDGDNNPFDVYLRFTAVVLVGIIVVSAAAWHTRQR